MNLTFDQHEVQRAPRVSTTVRQPRHCAGNTIFTAHRQARRTRPDACPDTDTVGCTLSVMDSPLILNNPYAI